MKKKQKKHKKKTSHINTAKTDTKLLRIGIERIQLEQDSGKTISTNERSPSNDPSPSQLNLSKIDLNRAGCALMEIVFRPDIRSAHQAAIAVTKLQSILKYIKSCDGKMEDGSLRCDLNISIAPYTSKSITNSSSSSSHQQTDSINDNSIDAFLKYLPLGTGNKVEVKNLNSIRQVIAATEYEAIRQAQLVYNQREGGEDVYEVEQETRTFDVQTSETVKIRRKGDAVDYRFLPEPNLPPLILNKETLNGQTLSGIINSLPELPNAACRPIMDVYDLSKDVAKILTSDPLFLDLFEKSVIAAVLDMKEKTDNNSKCSDSQELKHSLSASISNWICNDYLSLFKNSVSPDRNEYDSTTLSIIPMQLGQLIAMIHDETISKRTAKKILTFMHNQYIEHEKRPLPRAVAEEKGWKIISDPVIIREMCVESIQQHEKQLNEYKQGGKKVWKIEKFFAGKVIKASGGNAHPEKVREILVEVLEEAKEE